MSCTGIDLHQDSCYFATVDDAGTVVGQERLPNHPDRIMAYFHNLGIDHSAVVECTTGWYWLSDL